MGLTQILGFLHALLAQCVFFSEIPVADLSAESCVLFVPGCGHFFRGLGIHPTLVFVLQIRPLLFAD